MPRRRYVLSRRQGASAISFVEFRTSHGIERKRGSGYLTCAAPPYLLYLSCPIRSARPNETRETRGGRDDAGVPETSVTSAGDAAGHTPEDCSMAEPACLHASVVQDAPYD